MRATRPGPRAPGSASWPTPFWCRRRERLRRPKGSALWKPNMILETCSSRIGELACRHGIAQRSQLGIITGFQRARALWPPEASPMTQLRNGLKLFKFNCPRESLERVRAQRPRKDGFFLLAAAGRPHPFSAAATGACPRERSSPPAGDRNRPRRRHGRAPLPAARGEEGRPPDRAEGIRTGNRPGSEPEARF